MHRFDHVSNISFVIIAALFVAALHQYGYFGEATIFLIAVAVLQTILLLLREDEVSEANQVLRTYRSLVLQVLFGAAAFEALLIGFSRDDFVLKCYGVFFTAMLVCSMFITIVRVHSWQTGPPEEA